MQCDYNYLLDIYDKEISKKVQNKNKLYQFEVHKMANITSIYNDINNNTIPIPKYNIFLIKDPKYRIIMSVSIYDKLINHYYSRTVLDKKLSKYLDIRNVATRKNKGSSFGHKLLMKYIEEEKYHNKEFYILKIDISKYFYSIDHNVLKNLIIDKVTKEEYKYLETILSSTNQTYINETITKLKTKENSPTRKCEINALHLYNKDKGLSIGLLSNQFLAIFYLYKLHNYIIHKLKIKHLVVYMDDYILLHPSKEYLNKCLKEIEYILNNEYKLKLNKKKTMITSSKQGFVFLTYRYKVINNKTIVSVRADTMRKIKKNLRKNKKLFDKGYISFEKRFSSVNNYKNTFKYNKEKINNIIDKYN